MTGGLFGERTTTGPIDVAAFFDSDIVLRLWDIVSLGCLVSVGTTRDRGAVSITITKDGEYEREYFRRSDEASDWLVHATHALGGLNGSVAPVKAPIAQKARRGRYTAS